MNLFTIIGKNYISQARVLMESMKEHHPEGRRFVVLLDRVDGYFDPAGEGFELVMAEELGIPNWEEFCFKYNMTERCTAIKPYCFSRLFARYNLSSLVYLDPDIQVFSPLVEVEEGLGEYSVILTPHLTSPMSRDGCFPFEDEMLRSGTYNLGFMALKNTETSRHLLQWWSERLYEHCKVKFDQGLFVDQKWINLVPGMYDEVRVLRHEGYNVAYWNLQTRPCVYRDGRFYFNEKPLRFFHFSAYDPRNPGTVARHTNRSYFATEGNTSLLFQEYGNLLRAKGFDEAIGWPNMYESFDNGEPIADEIRDRYWKMSPAARGQYGNPFDTRGSDSYYRHLVRLGYIVPRGQPQPGLPVKIYRGLKSAGKATLLPVLRGTIGRNKRAWNKLKAIRQGLRHFRLFSQDVARPTRVGKASLYPFGVNLAGYVRSDKGVGEAVRSDMRILRVAGIPYVLNEVEDAGATRIELASGTITKENPYAINIVHVNADQFGSFAKSVGVDYFRDRYNIGSWAWELSTFPEKWSSAFDFFDEIWCLSRFQQDCVAKVSPVPTLTVPCTIPGDPKIDPNCDRKYFGLPDDRFLFLFTFDFRSVMERKNPLGTIEAFRKAFAGEKDAALVLKCSRPEHNPEGFARLKEMSADLPIYFVEGVLRREELNALMSICDCYVSLHRAEGFGLTIAESMVMEKPVVVTGYSGNMDFTTPNNSFLVKYDMVEIDKDHDAYPAGSVWADPDVDHAAELMRYVYEHRDAAKQTGQRARRDILEYYSVEALAGIVRDRLMRIARVEAMDVPADLLKQ